MIDFHFVFIIVTFIFISFFLIISIFGYLILYIINIKLKKRVNFLSLSFLEKLLISFGFGISIYISFCYFLSNIRAFNIFTAYISLLILDSGFLIYLCVKNKKSISFENLKIYIKNIFLNKSNYFTIFYLIFILSLSFFFIWGIITESYGLIRRDPYIWLKEIYFLLDKGYLDVDDTFGALYPMGYVIIIGGFLLPFPDHRVAYFLIKFSPIFYLFLIILVVFIISKKIFKIKVLIFFSLFLVLISNFFLTRIIIGIPSSFATIIISISFLLLIYDFPFYYFGFFISCLWLINPLAALYLLIVLFCYFVTNIARNRKNRKLIVKQFYSMIFLVIIFVVLFLPFIFSFPSFNPFEFVFYLFNRIVESDISSNFSTIKFNGNTYLLTFFLTFFNNFQICSILDNLSVITISIFLYFSFFTFLFKQKDKSINNLFIFFKLCLILVLFFFIIPDFFPNFIFISLFKYRPIEFFILPIVILPMISIEWLIKKSKKCYSIFRFKISSKKFHFLTKIFRIESIIIILVFSNIVWIYSNQKPPYYYYSYEDDINLNYLYLLNNAQPNSVIWRPPLEKPDIDLLLYNSYIYSYNLLSFENFTSLDNLLSVLLKNKTNYFIYKNPEIFGNFPQKWEDKSMIHSNITIETINFLDYHTNIVKIIDKADPLTYATFRDNSFTTWYYSGTFEWWLLREDTIGNDFHFYFRDQNYLATINVTISDFNKIQYWNGTSYQICSNFTNNEWHHFRVDFEFTLGKYENLGQYKFNIYLDKNKIAESCSMIYSNSSKIGWFEFSTIGATDLTAYIDSFAHSGDLYYEVSDNLFFNYYIPENISQVELLLNYSIFKLYKLS